MSAKALSLGRVATGRSQGVGHSNLVCDAAPTTFAPDEDDLKRLIEKLAKE